MLTDFVANLLVSLPAKEFWKSVSIRGSYGQEFSVFFFWLTRYDYYYAAFNAPYVGHKMTNSRRGSYFYWPAWMRVARECRSCWKYRTLCTAIQRRTHDWTRITRRRSTSSKDSNSSSCAYLKNTYNRCVLIMFIFTELLAAYSTLEQYF